MIGSTAIPSWGVKGFPMGLGGLYGYSETTKATMTPHELTKEICRPFHAKTFKQLEEDVSFVIESFSWDELYYLYRQLHRGMNIRINDCEAKIEKLKKALG